MSELISLQAPKGTTIIWNEPFKPSRRILDLFQEIHKGKNALEASDLVPILRDDWSLFCHFLSITKPAIKSILVPVDRVRQGDMATKKDLYDFLQNNPSIGRVILTSQDDEDNEAVEDVLDAICKSYTIKTLEFRRLHVKDPLPATFRHLQHAFALRTVSTMLLDKATEDSILQALAKCPKMNQCKIQGGPNSLRAPLHIESSLNYLSSLVLEQHVWSTASFQALGEHVAREDCSRLCELEIKAFNSHGNPDRTSDPIPMHFLESLARSSRLERIHLENLVWSSIPPENMVLLLRSPKIRSLYLHSLSDEQVQSLLHTKCHELKEMLVTVDSGISIETLRMAITWFESNSSLEKFGIECLGVPSLTWTRSSLGHICCHCEASFCPVDWELMATWMGDNSSEMQWTWSLLSMKEDDVLGICNILSRTKCRVTRLDLFWSSMFSTACVDFLVSTLQATYSLLHVNVHEGFAVFAVLSDNLTSLQQAADCIVARNRIRSLIQSNVTSAVWPKVLSKETNLSAVFMAMECGEIYNFGCKH